MPCLFALFALLTPRIVIVLLWFFSSWFHGMFPSILWPVLGFIFLPTTLLWYVAVHHWFGGHWTLILFARNVTHGSVAVGPLI